MIFNSIDVANTQVSILKIWQFVSDVQTSIQSAADDNEEKYFKYSFNLIFIGYSDTACSRVCESLMLFFGQ